MRSDDFLVRFFQASVIAIIGHMTSAMSETVPLLLINERKVLMISPTSSTNKLTGIDDYFLGWSIPAFLSQTSMRAIPSRMRSCAG